MSTSTTQVKKAMISSTVRDLPDHRKHVMEACQRQTLFPLMMENLPASDAEAISVSLKMVDDAEVYIGVFAFRYGYVPKTGNPQQISVTEMEYDHAKKRGIPRLIFIMDKTHPISFDQVEMGENAEKLKVFKEKIEKENIVNYFKSPDDLRALVINSLAHWHREQGKSEYQFHYVHELTRPPEPYIAHPYVLSQAKGLIGRPPELRLLTEWITGKRGLDTVRIFNVVAIGGMGKSALTWKWFNDIAPQEWPQMAGRFWWSFYESDAYFENFVIRALAYVSRRSIEEVKKIGAGEREDQLLAILHREPHLLVLDGLERILIAYARMDAAHFLADDDYDKATANFMAHAHGLSEAEKQTFLEGHRLRKTADPRAGNFLRKLTRVGASRILVSTRLYPFDLQMLTGDPLPGSLAIFLKGLSDDDALELWRSFGVSGARDELLPLFQTFDKHPLLLQALAGEVARYRAAPGDFAKWRQQKKDFNPFGLPLVQAKSHVLLHAMHGLSEAEQKALHTIAAFRMAAQYDTLRALLCGEDKPCADEETLDTLLNELEDRGLVGWDRRANRYDLHPVVRGVVWSGVSEADRIKAYTAIHGYFNAAPMVDEDDVNSLDDLTRAIELYNTLIELKRYDEASEVFEEHLSNVMLYRLGLARKRTELLERLFPLGLEFPPNLSRISWHASIINQLAMGFQFSGYPEKSIILYQKSIGLWVDQYKKVDYGTNLTNIAYSFLSSGKLKRAENAVRIALNISHEERNYSLRIASLGILGFVLSAEGKISEAESSLRESLLSKSILENIFLSHFAQHMIWCNDFSTSIVFVMMAQCRKEYNIGERERIMTLRQKGESILRIGDISYADERLHEALMSARAINFVDEELQSLIALAELRRRQGQPEEARQLLNDVWEAAERGPYRLLHADACNVLCQLERDAGNLPAAIAAATQAYRLAWCDGPPWAYHYGLENAKKHLRELGVKEPENQKSPLEGGEGG